MKARTIFAPALAALLCIAATGPAFADLKQVKLGVKGAT